MIPRRFVLGACPFCGEHELEFLASARTSCRTCGAVGPEIRPVRAGDPIPAPTFSWGSRPIEAGLQARIDELVLEARDLEDRERSGPAPGDGLELD